MNVLPRAIARARLTLGLTALLGAAAACGPVVIAGVASSGGGGGGGGGDGGASGNSPVQILLPADPAKLACLLITELSGDDPDDRNILDFVATVTSGQAAAVGLIVRARVSGGQSQPVAFEPVDPDNPEHGRAVTDNGGLAAFRFRATALPTTGSSYEIVVDVFASLDKLQANQALAQGRLSVHMERSIKIVGPAIYVDDQDRVVDAGDRLIVTLNQQIDLDLSKPPEDALELPRAPDDLGAGSVIDFGPLTGKNQKDRTKLTVTLGTGAALESRGQFPDTTGVDLLAGNAVITTLDGCQASIASLLEAVDVVPFFLDSLQELGVTANRNGFFTEAGAIGDINRDGYPDYVAANESGGDAHPIYLNLGAALPGFFDPEPAGYLTNTLRGQAVALGDLDRDGWLDAVLGVRGENKYDEVFRFDPKTMSFVSAGQLKESSDPFKSGRSGGGDSRFTETIVLLDVDCDGALDIVTGGNYAKSSTTPEWGIITWINNGGTGAALDFTLGQHLPNTNGTLPLVNQVRVMDAGDLNADGYPDLVVGRENGSARVLFFDPAYLGDSSVPAFVTGAAALLNDKARTKAAAIADFNLDGLNDVALLGSSIDAPPSVLMNDPAAPGTFPAGDATLLDSAANFQSMVVVDLDSDGDLDIVAGRGANFAEVNVVYLNDRTGTFCALNDFGGCDIQRIEFVSSGAATAANLIVNKTGYLGAADLDLDGDLDLIDGVRGRKDSFVVGDRVWFASLSGTWGTAAFSEFDPQLSAVRTQAVALRDFDGDGRLDVVMGNDGVSKIKLNQGGLTYSDAASISFGNGEDTRAIAVVDLNCNGRPDVVRGNHGSSSFVHFDFDAVAGFADRDLANTVENTTTSVAVLDLDRDGRLDLLLGNEGAKNLAYRNSGPDGDGISMFVRHPDYDFGDAAQDDTLALAAGDFDRDGLVDLVEGTATENFVWRNTGTGFTKARTFAKTATRSLAVEDVNKDGILDIVEGNDGEDLVRLGVPVLAVDGFRDFTLAAQFDLAQVRTDAVLVIDVDADGDPDLLCANDGGPQIYRNDGSGTYAATDSVPLGTCTAVAAGDVDRDGDVDFFLGRFDFPSKVLRND